MTWPTLPAFSANNFLDHFSGASLNARWTAITGFTSPAVAPGTVTVTDSYVDFNCAAHQAAAMYYGTKIDKTKSQLWQVCVSLQDSGGPNDLLWILDKSTAPAIDTYANIGTITRVRLSNADTAGGGAGLYCTYFDASHTQTNWDGATNAFTTTNVGAVAQTRASDYYIVGLEIDGVNARFRMMTWHQSYVTAGTYQWAQGLTMTALTDWVNWSSLEATTDLWLCLGSLYNNDGAAQDWRYEWVRYGEAPAGNAVLDGFFNQGGNPSSVQTNGLRHQYSYDGIIYVPQDRTTQALSVGSTYDANGISCPGAATDGTTDYLFYESTSATSAVTISGASATHANPQNGSWTKMAGNPLLSPGSGESAITFPYVFMDKNDSDANKRWKMLFSSKRTSDGFWRLHLATSPDPPTTWTDQGVIIDVGASGDFDAHAARDGVPLWYGGQWEVWYEAWDSSGFATIGRATGPSLTNLTKDGAGKRIGWNATPDTTIAATFAGNTVTVASSSGFVQDGYCWINPNVNADTYVTSRVRKVVDATTLELYHGVTTSSGWTFPVRIGQIDSSRHISPRHIIQVGSQWWFFINQWEPWFGGYDAGVNDFVEQEGGLYIHSAASPAGATPLIQHQPWPSPSRGFNTAVDSTTMENITLLNQPFTAQGIYRRVGLTGGMSQLTGGISG